jgi:hypothetical protein
MLDAEHEPRVLFILARKDGLKRRQHFLYPEVCQITQAPVVYSEDKNVGVACQPRRRDHGTVAAEDNDQVGIPERLPAAFVLDIGERFTDDSNIPLDEPFRKISGRLQRFRIVGFNDNADGFYLFGMHPAEKLG